MSGRGALARADEVIRVGGHPLALLDLDLTLVDNGPRTRAILGEWVDGLVGRLPEAAVGAMRSRVAEQALVFSIRDNIRMVLVGQGRSQETIPDVMMPFAKEGFSLWRQRFFDPSWLAHDVALPGAVDAVRALVGRGVTVAYVTARKVDMARDTVGSLLRLGFPVAGPRTLLVTNDHPTLGDHESKVAAFDFCARLGTVVLNAENEPAHANSMHERFPEALTVLVGTRHSEPAPPLLPGVVQVAGIYEAL